MAERSDFGVGAVNSNLRVLVVGNALFRIEGAANFLKRRGYAASFSNNIRDLDHTLQMDSYKFVFLSWNIPGIDPAHLSRRLEREFGLICVVFPEDDGVKTSMQIKKSGLPHSMQAPVNGHSMHMYMQRFLRDERQNEEQKKRLQALLNSMKSCSPEDFNRENPKGEWKMDQVAMEADRVGKVDKAVFVPRWFLSSESPNSFQGVTGTYTYRGEIAPARNDEGRWIFKGEGQLGFVAEETGRRAEDELEDTVELHQIPHSQMAQSSALEELRREEIEVSRLFTSESERYDSLEEGAQFALAQTVEPLGEVVESVHQTARVGFVEVKGKHTNGYFLVAYGNGREISKDLLERIRESFNRFMASRGEMMVSSDSFEIKTALIDFKAWGQEAAEFVLLTQHQDAELAVAFVESMEIAETMIEIDGSEMLTVQYRDIVPGSYISFDLFLYMPLNQKFIRHTAKGQIVHLERLQKVKATTCSLAIKSAEKQEFQRYRIGQMVRQNVTHFEVVR